MSERQAIGESELTAVRALGEQFDRLAARERNSRLGWRGTWRRRAGTLAFAGGLLVTAAAGAATGILPVGSVFRGEGFNHDTAKTNQAATGTDETVVATGTDPGVGRWQLTAFKSRETKTADGGVIEPAGLTCLKLRLLGPQAERYGGGGFCGETSDFTATFRTSADPTEPGAVLVFGWAPKDAAVVELTAREERIPADLGAPAGIAARFFLIAAPPGLRDARIDWIGADGTQHPGRSLSNAFQSNP